MLAEEGRDCMVQKTSASCPADCFHERMWTSVSRSSDFPENTQIQIIMRNIPIVKS